MAPLNFSQLNIAVCCSGRTTLLYSSITYSICFVTLFPSLTAVCVYLTCRRNVVTVFYINDVKFLHMMDHFSEVFFFFLPVTANSENDKKLLNIIHHLMFKNTKLNTEFQKLVPFCHQVKVCGGT